MERQQDGYLEEDCIDAEFQELLEEESVVRRPVPQNDQHLERQLPTDDEAAQQSEPFTPLPIPLRWSNW